MVATYDQRSAIAEENECFEVAPAQLYARHRREA